MDSLFICPVCSEKYNSNSPLIRDKNSSSVRCERGHSFDIAAKGYVNLLLSQHKNVKDPGDSKEMVLARQQFLNSGAYQPLRDAICDALSEHCGGIPEPIIADCGCGECYYTAGIYDKLSAMGSAPQIYGIDISKHALAAGKSRRSGRNIHCAAASVFRLPLASESTDAAAVIFAPMCREEILRILKPNGSMVCAIPAENHLWGLKKLLYKQPYLNEVKPYDIEGFDFIGKRKVSFTLTITEQDMLNALYTMTPYYYKTSREDSNKLYSYFGTNSEFSTEAAFEVLSYRKIDSQG
ncbi:MAG: putative RNA methyltransferase [Oscillospiraceae bacterium]